MTRKSIFIVLALFTGRHATVGQGISWELTGTNFDMSTQVVVVDQSGKIFAGSEFGDIYFSEDQASSFRKIRTGVSPPTVIVSHPNGTILVGWENPFTAGVQRSTDGGKSWSSANLSPNFTYLAGAVTRQGSFLMTYSRAIQRSTNNGESWSLAALPSGSSPIYLLEVDSIGSIFAATNGGIYRSSDDGLTWSILAGSNAFGGVRCVRALPSGDLMATVGQGIIRSTDGGGSWTLDSLSFSPKHFVMSHGTRMHLLAMDGSLYHSSDLGQNWEADSLSVAANDLAADGSGLVLAAAPTGLWKSLDDTGSWTQAGGDYLAGAIQSISSNQWGVWVSTDSVGVLNSDDLHVWSLQNVGLPSFHVRSFCPAMGRILAVVDSAGIYGKITADGEWSAVNTGLSTMQVRVAERVLSAVVMAGTENGAFRSTNGGESWVAASGLTGYDVNCFSKETQGMIFAGTRGNGVFVSSDQGSSWAFAGDPRPGSAITSILATGSGIYAAAHAPLEVSGMILHSQDGGSTWNPVMSDFPVARVRSLLVDVSGRVFAGTSAGVFILASGVWQQENAGLSQTDVSALHLVGDGILLAGTVSGMFQSSTPVTRPPALAFHWANAGSYHDWFTNIGAEFEEAFTPNMQSGAQWPAQYPWQDMKTSRALWLAASDFEDQNGTLWSRKVAHVGPRVSGQNEFFPVAFRKLARFTPPVITVNGSIVVDSLADAASVVVDPSLKADLAIESVVNTILGVTITRKIHQFSQPFHDNYVIVEYTFTNTGSTDYDLFAERYDSVKGFYAGFLHRNAINRQVRYIVNNSSGWGINTLNDARGVPSLDPPPYDIRCQFSWHGFHSDALRPSFPADFSNIGAPVWNPELSYGYASPADTNWRIGAPQFIGMSTLYVSASATNSTNDTTQPGVTSFLASDSPITRNNSVLDTLKMSQEYNFMTTGKADGTGQRHERRHAWIVVPNGNFASQNLMGNVGEGAPGGYSSFSGYGPFDLAPGESIRIVVAEGAAGLTREECVDLGLAYKQGVVSTTQKSDSVLNAGRERLFETFRRARANYESGYLIPRSPAPPAAVSVVAESATVVIGWTPNDAPGPVAAGYEVYRAKADRIQGFALVFSGDEASRSFRDTTAEYNVAYYYYVCAVGRPEDNAGTVRTPPGPLRSGWSYTLTPLPVRASPVNSVDGEGQIPASFSLAQNFPNPFNPSTTIKYGLPERCRVTLEIYNVLGQKVTTLVDEVLEAGYRTVVWDARLSTGLYFCRMEAVSAGNPDTRFVDVRKMVLVK